MKLSDEEKRSLILMARQEIERSLIRENSGKKQIADLQGNVHATCGAFVSLYVKDELRGCMGTFSESDLLCDNVRRMAIAAAWSDSRFRPVYRAELADLEIEISVLSPRKRISGPQEIIIGKHGIYIQKDSFRGTLLPQVAVNQNWDAEEFLGHCAKYKAGLEWEEWRSAELYTYEAIVIKSQDM